MEISNCKHCGGKRIERGVFYDICYVMCKDCKNSTQDHKEMKDAINEWNEMNGNYKS